MMKNTRGKSRDSFLEVLRRLGGSVGVRYCCREGRNDGIQEVQAVFVSCSREAWVREFGEPQHVDKDYDSTSGRWLWTWEQQMDDGPVRCIGQFFRRPPGIDWVVVKQLCVSQKRTKFDATSHPL